MTLSELFQRFRSDIDDQRTPYLWTNDDLESYFNWALEDLAKKTQYFLDQTTYAGLTITADDPKITATASNYLDRILFIRRAVLVSTSSKLRVLTMSKADSSTRDDDYGHIAYEVSSGWETQTGVPQLVIPDYYTDGSLRIGPIPSAADTLNLWVYRLPLRLVTLAQSSKISLKELVGITEHNHELTLVQGMKFQAYLKEDPEARDDELAEQTAGIWAGQLADIRNELMRRRHPVGKVRYGGI